MPSILCNRIAITIVSMLENCSMFSWLLVCFSITQLVIAGLQVLMDLFAELEYRKRSNIEALSNASKILKQKLTFQKDPILFN
jgi:hypothetical protein